ncbi:O-antigen ligase family protein [Parasalinivibrio latis]|uniref:O-antigen ligase family protein n=1 Tax=Parasalinivibrio latis TaxID=2952610 RepID=UPI0030E4D5A9
MKEVNKKNLMSRLHNVIFYSLAIWFYTGQFFFVGNNKKLATVTAICFFVVAIISKLEVIRFNIQRYREPIYLIFLSVLSLAIFKYTSDSSSTLLRTLFICLFFSLLIPRNAFSINSISILFSISSLFLLGMSLYAFIYLNIPRGWWKMNPIPFSTISVSLLVMSTVLFFSSSKKRYRCINIISIVAAAMLLAISQTRGAWVAVLVCLPLIIIYQRRWKALAYTLLLVLVAGVFSAFSKPTLFTHQIESRLQQTKTEIQRISNNDYGSSIGLRISMWKSSFLLLNEQPFFGYGNNFQQSLNELSKRHLIPNSLISFHPVHFHNQTLDSLVRYGIIGTIMLLLPIITYTYRRFKERRETCSFVSLMLILTFFICSLTDVPLSHPESLSFFLISLSLLYHCSIDKKISNNV